MILRRREVVFVLFCFFHYRHNISWSGRMPRMGPGNWENAVFNLKGMQLAFKPKLGTLLQVNLFISYLYELRSHFLLLLEVISSTFPPISVCLGKRESRAQYEWCLEIFFFKMTHFINSFLFHAYSHLNSLEQHLFPPPKYISLFMESCTYGEFYCLPLFCMEYAALGYGDNRPICLLEAGTPA